MCVSALPVLSRSLVVHDKMLKDYGKVLELSQASSWEYWDRIGLIHSEVICGEEIHPK